MFKRLLVVLVGLLGAGYIAIDTTQAQEPPPSDFVFVCKYVITPGGEERLQGGGNPIRVSINAVPSPVVIGAFFADAQGRSVVIAFDVGQPDPPVTDCPPPGGGTTTSSSTSQPPTPFPVCSFISWWVLKTQMYV